MPQLPFAHYVSIGLLLVLIALQKWKRPLLEKRGTLIFWTIVVIILGIVLFETRTSFMELVNAPAPARYYAPPYQSVWFFIVSAWSRIIAPYVLSYGVSIVILAALTQVQKYRDRFDAGEPQIIAIAVLMLRHPFWLIFCALALLIYVAASLTLSILKGKDKRLSFYRFWLPLAVIVLASAPILSAQKWIAMISFANVR